MFDNKMLYYNLSFKKIQKFTHVQTNMSNIFGLSFLTIKKTTGKIEKRVKSTKLKG